MMQHKLILVSGPSGSGKTTIMRNVMSNEIVSFTTREARKGEVDGYDYDFISVEEFHRLKEADRLIEWTEYSGNFYGISKDELEAKLSFGPAFAIVDFNGMQQLNEYWPNNIKMFIYCEMEEAYNRLGMRGDSKDKIESRMRTFQNELENSKHYDIVIHNRNGHLENTIRITSGIIDALTGE